ncbi:MAG: Appr-1-p processing protein [Cellulomonas sp. 73-92]|nr:MAG: Appr-1-p processing protein [Cellulomonas sp. 73-92]
MIEEARGNLLAADVDALVNTVNTVGVMGKGIALQFRRAYPAMFESYVAACKAGEVEVGRMHVWPTGSMSGPRYVINFPTKRHWRAPSRLEFVDAGLVDLVRVIREREISSIAIPPLGAGSGGLDWRLVKPRIVAALDEVADVRVLLYEPNGAPAAADMARPAERKPLTPQRAALVGLLARYLTTAVGASLIEVQKLMYFLQEAGEPLRLQYQRHHYGPYADNLRHVLRELEGSYLTGYGDASAKVIDAEPITLLPGAAEEAEAVLAEHPDTQARMARVLELVDGFDSMYGTELLATVHWVATHESPAPADLADVRRRVQKWSRRKRELFTDGHIEIAWDQLRDERWVAA